MYDKKDLKFKLQHYSERGDAELQGFVDILTKSLKDRLEEDKIYGVPYLTDKNLEDVVAKNTTMTMGIIEAVETKYNIDKMVKDYEDYYNNLINVIRFSNMKYENNTNEVKDTKSKTFTKVSKIISRVSSSRTVDYPTYHYWKWFDGITEEINKVLNDRKLSEHKFDVEFVSTDTMSIAEGDKFKVITVMYFKLTEYIPDEE